MGYVVVVYDTVASDPRHKDGSIPSHTAIVGGIFGVGSLRGNLSGADLTGANLTGTNLFSVNLTGANLTGATNLTQKQLEEGAILSGANLFRALLNQKQLEAPAGDEDTKLPPTSSPLRTGAGRPTNSPRRTERTREVLTAGCIDTDLPAG
jgi:hypothetical protein